jgi:SAM-dependent methyltransferase
MPEDILKRIIAASSKPGDCVLDPFSGSGTTAAAAYQLGRNYVGIEISQKYVENSRQRLDKLKEESRGNSSFSSTELGELRRLVSEMEIPIRKITGDNNLLELFAKQFNLRMNNHKQYGTEKIAAALGNLAY